MSGLNVQVKENFVSLLCWYESRRVKFLLQCYFSWYDLNFNNFFLLLRMRLVYIVFLQKILHRDYVTVVGVIRV